MPRATKDEARKAVAVYGDLLQERAVISEIATEEVRGEMLWTLTVEGEFPTKISCRGIQETALVMTSMWFAYSNAMSFLGYEEPDRELIY